MNAAFPLPPFARQASIGALFLAIAIAVASPIVADESGETDAAASSPAPRNTPMPTPALADWRAFDQLWDYNDPAATEAKFLSLLPEAEASGDAESLAALLSQIARTRSLRGEFDAAHPLLDRAESLLPAGEPSAARVRVLLERGRCFNSAGEKARARPLFLDAFEMAKGVGADFLAIDAAHMMGIAAPPEEQLGWSMRALALAEASADPKARGWAGSLLNNIGWSLHDLGRFDEALDHFERALAFRQAQSPPNANAIRVAKWAVARAMRSLGRVDEALAIQNALLAEHEAAGSNDGFVHEELGELLLLLNRPDEARSHFAKAHAALSKDAWFAKNEGERLERMREMGGGGE